jgi:hydroxyquinol 1,2-dioxygenase
MTSAQGTAPRNRPLFSAERSAEVVTEAFSDTPDPRLRTVITALVEHLHAFAKEVALTQAELDAAIDFLTRTGKICDDKRQEFILCSDVLGVSMLVDAINNRLPSGATPTTVEGPFHIPDAPEIANGGNMAKDAPGIPTVVVGKVRSLEGQPIAGAVLDLWQTDGEGLYESQKGIDEPWMRGLYHAQPDGSFAVRTVAPIAYTIPMDGTVGELVSKTKISHFRPAHIHFAVSAPGHHPVVTHLFQKGDEYIENDVVYGVKEPLIVEFVKRPPGKAPNGEMINEPWYEVHYDFVLQRQAKAQAA